MAEYQRTFSLIFRNSHKDFFSRTIKLKQERTKMYYESLDFSEILGVEGLSDELLENHFKLYRGYVEKTNEILSLLDEYAGSDEAKKIQFVEARRRLGWELNGMRLHEYYFENMTKKPVEFNKESDLYKQIEADFGSFEDWKKDFQAAGMMRGVGWAILYYDLEYGRLLNMWIGEHNSNHLAGGVPLLIMDVWEHAYMVDYGLKKDAYIDAFMKAIDWEMVLARFGESTEEVLEEEAIEV